MAVSVIAAAVFIASGIGSFVADSRIVRVGYKRRGNGKWIAAASSLITLSVVSFAAMLADGFIQSF